MNGRIAKWLSKEAKRLPIKTEYKNGGIIFVDRLRELKTFYEAHGKLLTQNYINVQAHSTQPEQPISQEADTLNG